MRVGDRYGAMDRLLHRIAFRAGTAQRAMADVEEMLYGDRLASIPLETPVFVTALPRSGTTILLKLLAESGRFASHTYRDMPFVLCPMLWSRFSRRFAVEEEARERAHGDGLEVSPDSPEAFEERIWKEFWPGHYRDDRILPWTSSERNPGFDDFLESHMRKVVAVRAGGGPGHGDGGADDRDGDADDRPAGAGDRSAREAPARYVSKNNLNVARLAAPPRPLRRGVFVIPFREPVQQAASMLNQHRRFLEIHREDDFVREYMEAIGHHEFGRGLKPVDFGGWLEEAPPPDGLPFWLRYWIAAYRFVLEHAGDGSVLVSYARLTGEPQAALARLAEELGVPGSELADRADRLRPPRTHDVDRDALPDADLREAEALREELRERAAV